MPADFKFGVDTEVWITIRKTEDWSDRSNPPSRVGHLRSGTTVETANSDLTTLFQGLKEGQPASIAQTEVGPLITPYRERVVGQHAEGVLIIQTSLASPEFAATEPAMIRVQRVIERLKTFRK